MLGRLSRQDEPGGDAEAMLEAYRLMLELARAHREAVMKGDLVTGESLLERQEALAKAISSEPVDGVPPTERAEILGTIREIQQVHEEICSRLREEARACSEEITSTVAQKRALTAYGYPDGEVNIRFDRRK